MTTGKSSEVTLYLDDEEEDDSDYSDTEDEMDDETADMTSEVTQSETNNVTADSGNVGGEETSVTLESSSASHGIVFYAGNECDKDVVGDE